MLNAVDSPHTRRAYQRALLDFIQWYQAQPSYTVSLNKATVQAYRTYLRDTARLSTSSINQRLSAIRKLAAEAADNELVSHNAAGAIRSVAGVKQAGRRAGNWLTLEQAQALLSAPGDITLKGKRDRAVLAVLLGCGLRRSECASLRWSHFQKREGRWVIIDLIGKRGKIRSVPLPEWARGTLDRWASAAGIANKGEGPVFLALTKGEHVVNGQAVSAQTLRDIVAEYAAKLGLGEIAPHDLRRTFAKLADKGGAGLVQIQLSLGHASVKTTEIYLGSDQDLVNAPGDRLGLH